MTFTPCKSFWINEVGMDIRKRGWLFGWLAARTQPKSRRAPLRRAWGPHIRVSNKTTTQPNHRTAKSNMADAAIPAPPGADTGAGATNTATADAGDGADDRHTPFPAGQLGSNSPTCFPTFLPYIYQLLYLARGLGGRFRGPGASGDLLQDYG